MNKLISLFPKPARAAAVAVAVATLVASCGPLISFGDDGPGDKVYSLKYAGDYENSPADAPVIYIDEPHMADALAGQKITVALPGEKRSTLSGARWAAPLSALVRDYVARALSHKAGAHMIGEGGLDIQVSCRLGTKVWSFEFVPTENASGDHVQIALEMTLVRLADGKLLSHPTFTKTMPVRGSTGDAVASAFSEAMAGVGDDMGRWLKGQIASCASG